VRDVTTSEAIDTAAVPVYQWHCLVPCLTTKASVKSLHPSSSLDSGFMSNLFYVSSLFHVIWNAVLNAQHSRMVKNKMCVGQTAR